ncbi:hypothetical protein Q6331_29705, partial [Klebsiella pneumoniae]
MANNVDVTNANFETRHRPAAHHRHRRHQTIGRAARKAGMDPRCGKEIRVEIRQNIRHGATGGQAR